MKRIMIAGTNSGCGKTTVTCALLQALVNREIKTSAFKCGPDYIDTMFHQKIIGVQSNNLDAHFCDKDKMNFLIAKNSFEMSVIEGVMGFYDGVGEKFSSHCISIDTGTPVIIVIDCKGMGESVGAVMNGFLNFKKPNNIIGFIFNKLPESLINTAKKLCSEMNTEYFGRFPYEKKCVVESRHLGLVTADEIENIKEKMQILSRIAEDNLLIDKIIDFSKRADDLQVCKINYSKIDDNVIKIAVAYDRAFCFYYEENFQLLREMGCEIVYFSPLFDKKLPDGSSGLIIGGGYPELYAKKLSENASMLEDIREKIGKKMPVIAECGGFMYLQKFIEDTKKNSFEAVGIFDGYAFKTEKLQRFGYVDLIAKNDCMLCKKGEKIAAHEFHYWDCTSCGDGFTAKKLNGGASYDCAFSSENMYAGFPHLYFYSDPKIAENFIKKCLEFRDKNEQDQ